MESYVSLLDEFRGPPKVKRKKEKPTILFIDDDPSMRRGLSIALSYQYQVLTAASGQEGIALLTKSVHCVILDIKMDGLDGFATYRDLKTKEPNIPIIFYTAFQDEHSLKDIINRFKPEGYLEKGRGLALLENLVVQAVDKYKLILRNERSQLAVRESEEHFKSLMESSEGFAVYRLSIQGTNPPEAAVVFVSPSIIDLMGVSDPKIFDSWLQNIHPDDRERVDNANLRVLQTHRFNEEMRIFHPKKKTWRWIHAISTGVLDHGGSLKYVNGIIIDITSEKTAEEALRRREEELEENNKHLQEINTALDVLLKKREKDRMELESRVLTNMEELVKPILTELRLKLKDDIEKSYLEILETTLNDIISPFGRKLSSNYRKLTPTEIQIADLIRHGKTTKEIAPLLGVSTKTVEVHRKSIRKKTGIVNKKVNLQTHLLSVLD